MKIVWNGKELCFDNERETVYNVFLLMINRIKFQPAAVLKKNMMELCDMFIEILEPLEKKTKDEHKKKEYSSLIRKLMMFSGTVKKLGKDYLTGNKMTERIYNFLLNLDNLETLHGFGFSNRMKDKLKGNSEKQSAVIRNYKESEYQIFQK